MNVKKTEPRMMVFKSILLGLGLLIGTFAISLFAETKSEGNSRAGQAQAGSIPPAPYQNIGGSLADVVLNGNMMYLMPQYCAFYQPGEGGPCEPYWYRAVNNLTRPGGSPRLAYCENLQIEINSPNINNDDCFGYADSQQCKLYLEQNYINYCTQ